MENEKQLTKKEKRALAKVDKEKTHERGESTNKVKNWVIGLLVVAALIFAGYRAWVWINTPQPEVGEIFNGNGKDWVKGNEEASVTLVEYSDFACPACASYQPNPY